MSKSKAAKSAARSKPVAKKAAPAAKSQDREQQNAVTRPRADTLCGRVWAALDKLRAKEQDTTFEAVREMAGSDMADATIRTQRQRWREFSGIKREEKKPVRKPGKAAVAKQAAPAVVTEEAQQPSA